MFSETRGGIILSADFNPIWPRETAGSFSQVDTSNL